MRTPLLYAAIPFAVGIVLQRDFSVFLLVVALLLFALVWRRWVPILLFSAAGFTMALLTEHHNQIPYNSPIEVVVRVETAPTLSKNKKWQRTTASVIAYREIEKLTTDSVVGKSISPKLDLDESDSWHSTSQKTEFYMDTARCIALGNTLHFKTKHLKIDSTFAPYFHNRGVFGTMFSREFELVDSDTTFLEQVKLFSQSLSDKIARVEANSEAIALMQALTLGNKQEITSEQRHENVRAGTAHMLAVSGLHVGIIVMMLIPLFSWILLFRRGQLLYGVVLIILLWVYAALTGFSPSVLRAVIMFSLYQLGVILSRSSNNVNTLLAAGLVLLLYDPNYLYDIGFQLSFVAMFGIAMLFSPIYNLWRNRLWALVAVSLSAQVAVIPLACYYFGNIPLFGIVSNLALWVIVPAIILLTFIYLFTSFIFFGELGAWVASIYNGFVGWTSSHSWVAIENIKMPIWLLLLIYAIMLSLYYAIFANPKGVKRLWRRIVPKKSVLPMDLDMSGG